MSTNTAIDSKQQSSRFARAGTSGFCVALLVVSLVNAFVLIFIVPKFGQIFHDMYGGNPLPTITTFIIGSRLALAALSTVVPVAGVVVSCFGSRAVALATLWVLMLATSVQVAMTVFALFLPLISTVQTMSAA